MSNLIQLIESADTLCAEAQRASDPYDRNRDTEAARDLLSHALEILRAPRGDAQINDYTLALATRLNGLLAGFVSADSRDIAHIIAEACYQIGIDIRRGETVNLECVGRFRQAYPSTVIYYAAPELLGAPLSDRPEPEVQ